MRTTTITRPPLGNMAAVIEQFEAEPRHAATPSLLGLAAPKSGETVIDLGCRVLADSFRALRRVGPAGRVRGIVVRGADLEHATALRDRWVFADLAYKCAPLTAVPLADAVADIVILDAAPEPPDEPLRILEEACRLLAPKGRLALGVTTEEAGRLRSLLDVLGLEIRTMRHLGPGRTGILAIKS